MSSQFRPLQIEKAQPGSRQKWKIPSTWCSITRTTVCLPILPTTGQLLEVRENPGGNLDRTTVIRHNAQRLGIQDPQGMTLDEKGGGLFILDAAGPRIVRIQLGPGRSFTGGRVSVIDLKPSGVVNPGGIAFDPTTGHLHVRDRTDQKLYELRQGGQVVAIRDLVPFGLENPGAMVFAPSSDQTDDPAQMNLFLADSGLISRAGRSAQQFTEPGRSECVSAKHRSNRGTLPRGPGGTPQRNDLVAHHPGAHH